MSALLFNADDDLRLDDFRLLGVSWVSFYLLVISPFFISSPKAKSVFWDVNTKWVYRLLKGLTILGWDFNFQDHSLFVVSIAAQKPYDAQREVKLYFSIARNCLRLLH